MSLSSNLISQSIRINKRQDYSLLLVKVGFIKIFHYIFVTMAVKLEKKRQEKKSNKAFNFFYRANNREEWIICCI